MSQLVIEVVNVEVKTVPTAKGQYRKATLIYKNKSFQDKVEEKQLMDFTFPKVFNIIETSKFGDVFTIDRNKNDKGYWDWTDIVNGNNPVPQATTQGENMNQAMKATPSPKSTYETPEERAKRQIMIVRQSSIANAVASLKLDKAALNPDEVIAVARRFETYVLGETISDIESDPVFEV